MYYLLIESKNINYNMWFSNAVIGNYLLILINIMKPFYNINHILLHITTWFMLQNAYKYIETGGK
jgi:hypothetical protein